MKGISFRPYLEDQTYIVMQDGERLGFVRYISRGKWTATDTYLVGLRGTMKSRDAAVKALQRREVKRSTAPTDEKRTGDGR